MEQAPPKRDMEVALLRAFLAVVDHGGMTAASAQLNLTQAAVSQQVKRLEAAFGAQLFDRAAGRKLLLTAEGERLVSYARRMLALDAEMWRAMTVQCCEGEVRLGVPYDIVGVFMPPILRRFAKIWPNIQVTLVCKPTKTLTALLAAGEIDLTLTTEPDPGDEVLAADPLVWVGAPNGVAHLADPLPLVLDSEECMFRQAGVAALSKRGRDWRITCTSGDAAPTMALLSADVGVAMLMRRSVPPFLAIIGDGALPPLPTFFVNLLQPATALSGPAQEMVRHLREGFATLSGDANGAAAGGALADLRCVA